MSLVSPRQSSSARVAFDTCVHTLFSLASIRPSVVAAWEVKTR